MSANGWRNATKRSPCPVCAGPDWCDIAPDGDAAVCGRIDANAPPAGWRSLRNAKDGRPIFQREREGRGETFSRNGRARPAPKPEPVGGPALDWERELEALPTPSDNDLDVLAGLLRVLRAALLALGIRLAGGDLLRRWHAGFAGEGARPTRAWATPERDGRGHIVGVSVRADDGRKGAPSREHTGARRGLVFDPAAFAKGGRALVVEGASDVAACLTLGLVAVGRPSNAGGAEDLAELRRGCDVLIVGENDAKPDGRWPGRDGAARVAQELANRWGRPVRWALPPPDADVRGWSCA